MGGGISRDWNMFFSKMSFFGNVFALFMPCFSLCYTSRNKTYSLFRALVSGFVTLSLTSTGNILAFFMFFSLASLSTEVISNACTTRTCP